MCTWRKEWKWLVFTSQLVETAVYVVTYIPFLDSHSPYIFIKKDLKLLKEKELEMIPEYGRTEAQSLP